MTDGVWVKELKAAITVCDRDGIVLEMNDRAEAEKAIAGTNGTELNGRPLRVNESQPKPREERRGGGGRW